MPASGQITYKWTARHPLATQKSDAGGDATRLRQAPVVPGAVMTEMSGIRAPAFCVMSGGGSAPTAEASC